MPVRRIRGTLLRLSRRRPIALAIGALLALPSAWIEFTGRSDVWWVNGLALVAGATGVALIWAGTTGARPDWVDED